MGPAAHKSVMKTNPLTVQITPSVSAGTGCGRNRPLADAWGYLAAPRDRMRNRFSTVPHKLTGDLDIRNHFSLPRIHDESSEIYRGRVALAIRGLRLRFHPQDTRAAGSGGEK